MFDHPTAGELIAAVRMQIEQHVIPTLAEPRLRFQTLVAANVLAIIERELLGAEPALLAAWRRMADLEGQVGEQPAGQALREAVVSQNTRLCRRIRAGNYDHGPARHELLAHLRATAEAELSVANPRYLERVTSEDLEDADKC
jgi:hypothetical protein